jgi:hypothetical protein
MIVCGEEVGKSIAYTRRWWLSFFSISLLNFIDSAQKAIQFPHLLALQVRLYPLCLRNESNRLSDDRCKMLEKGNARRSDVGVEVENLEGHFAQFVLNMCTVMS